MLDASKASHVVCICTYIFVLANRTRFRKPGAYLHSFLMHLYILTNILHEITNKLRVISMILDRYKHNCK